MSCECLFKGAGQLIGVRTTVAGKPRIEFGNFSQIDYSADINVTPVPDFVSGVGACYTDRQVNTVTLAVAMYNLCSITWALTTLGTLSNTAAGPVVDEAHTIGVDGFVQMDLLRDLSVAPVVTSSDGLTTYDDWLETQTGIKPVAGGDLATAADAEGDDELDILIDYTSIGTDTINPLTQLAGEEMLLHFDGKNSIGGNPHAGKFYKARFQAAPTTPLVGSSIANPSAVIDLAADTSIVGTGLSQYGTFMKAEAA